MESASKWREWEWRGGGAVKAGEENMKGEQGCMVGRGSRQNSQLRGLAAAGVVRSALMPLPMGFPTLFSVNPLTGKTDLGLHLVPQPGAM